MKTLKRSDELIIHMKQKGIRFNIVNERDAKSFLQNNNYYMKLASYRANYDKRSNGEYINLEFAYLKELSTIDMYLRYLILEMCLDIEHALKIILLRDIEENNAEDGYNIIRKFVNEYDRCLQNIDKHKSSEYCKHLIEKYYPDFPVWVFVELISFGDLVKLYEFYEKYYPKRLKEGKLLYSIRDLRNAAAHSNCLINKLYKGTHRTSANIIKFVASIDTIGKSMRNSKLSNKFLGDFTTLLYVYSNVIKSEVAKKKRFRQLSECIHGRFRKNEEYFEKNEVIKGAYIFIQKIVDYFASKC